MITLYFLRSWLKVLATLTMIVLIEYGCTTHSRVLFLFSVLPTVAGFTGITVLMYRDWKTAHRHGSYRYDIVRDITHT